MTILFVVACHGLNNDNTLPGTVVHALQRVEHHVRNSVDAIVFSASWEKTDCAREQALKEGMFQNIPATQVCFDKTITQTIDEVRYICDIVRDPKKNITMVCIYSDAGHVYQMADMIHFYGNIPETEVCAIQVPGVWNKTHVSVFNRSIYTRRVAWVLRGVLWFLRKHFGVRLIEQVSHPVRKREC